MTETTTTQEFYSVKQVARRLGVSKLTIQRRIADGKIRAFRTNGESGPYRISQEALDEYVMGDKNGNSAS